MRYRYRGGPWEGSNAPAPESVIRALADELLDESSASVIDRALHKGLDLGEEGQYAGLDSVREQLQETLSEAWADVDWDIVREHLREAPAQAADGDGNGQSGSSRELAATAQQARMEARLGASGQLQALADGLEQNSAQFTGLPSPLRQELEKLRNLGELLDLEAELGAASSVQDLEQIDLQLLRELIGEERASQFAGLVSALNQVTASGYLDLTGSSLRLSPRALRHMAHQFLTRQLDQTTRAGGGRHPVPHRSGHGERTGLSRALDDGDTFDVAIGQTVLEAARRSAPPPVKIDRDDFQVYEREQLEARHTILAIDVSRSMNARNYLNAAKRLALALTALVQQRFPRDRVDILAFSRTAWNVAPHEIAGLEWDRHRTGTNIQDALHLARRNLRGQRRLQRQVILVTDGEPTAYRDSAGEVHYVEPASEEALAATYGEATRLYRDGIELTVAVVSEEVRVLEIASQLARQARGQLLEVHPGTLETELVGMFAG